MKRYKIYSIALLVILTIGACEMNLDLNPNDPDVTTSATVYNDPESWTKVLAKCYAGMAVSGQKGPDGKPDISDIDEGFSTYLRQYWCASQLPTDEAVIGWGDAGLKDYHYQNWSSNNQFITAMYNRIYYQISLVNEYIRAIDQHIGGLNNTLKSEVTMYRAEARFLRALSYWHALDLYGSVPFVTEKDVVGAFMPKQISRNDLFHYIESELLDIQDQLAEPLTNDYGRADQAAAWTLLAKLYLNAKVYIDTAKYTQCITYCNKVIGADYYLDPSYAHLFQADNNTSPEIIFPVTFDGTKTQTWGGMCFIIHAQLGGSMTPANFAMDGKWGGYRVTKAFVQKFSDISGNTDKRAMFYTDGQSLEIADISIFTDGYAITKFTNKTSTGADGSNTSYPDTDFPMFRLADVYLMYAEAVLRGGTGGSASTALGYLNDIRFRAYGDHSGDITSGDLTLQFIIDERSRELYCECHRRTDLIRFGMLTGDAYLWPWKGGVAVGKSTNSKYNLMPIPSSDLGANTNLKPTPGY